METAETAAIPIAYETCAKLPSVPQAVRDEILVADASPRAHRERMASLAVFGMVEVQPPPKPGTDLGGTARIAFWNSERGRHPDLSADLMKRSGADVFLLGELDIGMARTDQRHTARDLAARLDHGYAYGVEYLELGLGDRHEQRELAGLRNSEGLHGAAILAPVTLRRPALLRLEADGDWFNGDRGERRIGGRIAVLATIALGRGELVLASVHLESHTNPEHRARQMRVLLDGVEMYAAGLPVVIGGDFNSKSIPRDDAQDPETFARHMREAPERLVDPVPFEPLFDVAAAAGYDWRRSNAPGVTTRVWRTDKKDQSTSKLDWMFTRGVEVSHPAIHAAVDCTGRAVSDHDLLAVTITPQG
ncbi:MAG: endonuclease/exonuclease/phosphatase [Rhodospirillales bacterium]|nr:endonuclease/exonuclease/phosphatase [Rhodospirillales bacterium]